TWGEGRRSRLAPYSRVADVQVAITFLGAQPEVDEDRIGIYGTSYGGATVTWVAAVDKRVKCTVSVVGIGHGERWMSRVRRPYEWKELLERSKQDRVQRALTGRSEYADRNQILLPDPDSLRLATAARQQVKGAVSEIPLEYVDDTVGFNPEWVVDKIAPRPILFITSDNDLLVLPEESEELYKRAGEPKKLVVLKGYSHYEVYAEPAFSEVMAPTIEWFRHYLPPR
ncbi:MAG TPA: prolyl oligopeptidase family serine peptidase, partial [Dehalococcoidia bacterium]|nr:prolyl oligopeptidase family serine peptidase [Dehalococcoidia bacterium]